MTDKKITDSEIIKALDNLFIHKYAVAKSGDEFITIGDVANLINRLQAKSEALQMDNQQLQSDIVNANMNADHALAVIKRLEKEKHKLLDAQMFLAKQCDEQKAEIERLTTGLKEAANGIAEAKKLLARDIEKSKAEARKEFAERLKSHSRKMQSSDFSGEFWDKAVLVSDIDNLLKEMERENNAIKNGNQIT